MEFKDHFSFQAARYAQFRPHYPPQLFDYLASLTAEHKRAWDCGTGNGQAAVELAERYAAVIATDASETQIVNAQPHPRVTYLVSHAEQTEIESNSVDLVTVAQALHWFRFDDFYAEVRRVIKPDGVLAAWCYGLATISAPVDEVVWKLYTDIVGPYWPADRKFIEERYETIPFPFERISPPALEMEAEWSYADLIGYLGTWSAVKRYDDEHSAGAISVIAPELAAAWGAEEWRRRVSWKLNLLATRF